MFCLKKKIWKKTNILIFEESQKLHFYNFHNLNLFCIILKKYYKILLIKKNKNLCVIIIMIRVLKLIFKFFIKIIRPALIWRNRH